MGNFKRLLISKRECQVKGFNRGSRMEDLAGAKHAIALKKRRDKKRAGKAVDREGYLNVEDKLKICEDVTTELLERPRLSFKEKAELVLSATFRKKPWLTAG